jgi:hypothetical protein
VFHLPRSTSATADEAGNRWPVLGLAQLSEGGGDLADRVVAEGAEHDAVRARGPSSRTRAAACAAVPWGAGSAEHLLRFTPKPGRPPGQQVIKRGAPGTVLVG